MTSPFSHFDEAGASRMVDVSAKPTTVRTARVTGRVTLSETTLDEIVARRTKKGDVCEVARLAGIMAAKQTPNLIPLCHPLPIDAVTIDIEPVRDPAGLQITAEVRTAARTGVEMEALTAATVTALTIYDMCKSLDRGMTLGPFQLIEKRGGQSGVFRREACEDKGENRKSP